jgi:hypothetical protein
MAHWLWANILSSANVQRTYCICCGPNRILIEDFLIIFRVGDLPWTPWRMKRGGKPWALLSSLPGWRQQLTYLKLSSGIYCSKLARNLYYNLLIKNVTPYAEKALLREISSFAVFTKAFFRYSQSVVVQFHECNNPVQAYLLMSSFYEINVPLHG